MLPVIFTSMRPTDGAEIVEDLRVSNRVLRYRTVREEPFDLEITDLSNPVVIEFINASAQNRLVDFVGRYGLLDPGAAGDRFPSLRSNACLVDGLNKEAHMLHAQLKGEGKGGDSLPFEATLPDDFSERVKLIDESLKHAPLNASYRLFGPEGRGQLVVRVKSLRGFMTLEIALAHECGAEPRACERCGKLFLVGHLTGRRRSSLYCSDSCRVMASRDRKMERKVPNVGS